MTEIIDKRLWLLGADNPELQKVIVETLKKDSGGYKMPLGNIREYIFEKDISEKTRERTVKQIKDIDNLSFRAVSQAFTELKLALVLKDIQGETLTPLEKTFKDIDITALVLLGFRHWLALVTHDPAPEEPVEGSKEE